MFLHLLVLLLKQTNKKVGISLHCLSDCKCWVPPDNFPAYSTGLFYSVFTGQFPCLFHILDDCLPGFPPELPLTHFPAPDLCNCTSSLNMSLCGCLWYYLCTDASPCFKMLIGYNQLCQEQHYSVTKCVYTADSCTILVRLCLGSRHANFNYSLFSVHLL